MKSSAFTAFFVSLLVIMGVFMIAAAYDGNNDDDANDGNDDGEKEKLFEPVLLYGGDPEDIVEIWWLGGDDYKVITAAGHYHWRLLVEFDEENTIKILNFNGEKEFTLLYPMNYIGWKGTLFYIDTVNHLAGLVESPVEEPW